MEIGGHPRVIRVFCDFPAAKTGLIAGDLILSVNDVDSRVQGALSVDRPGLVFDAMVERNGAILHLTLVAVQHPALTHGSHVPDAVLRDELERAMGR